MSDKFWEMLNDYAPLWLLTYVWGWTTFLENWHVWSESFSSANCIYLSVFDCFCADYTSEIGEVSQGAWTENEKWFGSTWFGLRCHEFIEDES